MMSNIQARLFFLCVFLIPFTGIKGIGFLGELKGEAHVYPLLFFVVLSAICFFQKWEGRVDRNYIYFFLFVIFVFASLFVNISGIYYGDSFKGVSRVSRFISQLFVLLVYGTFSYFLYYFVRARGVAYVYSGVEKSLLSVFIVCSIFCIFEIPYVIGYDFTLSFLDSYSYIFRDFDYHSYLRRLRSVSFEAPSFGMFLPIVYGVVLFSGRLSVLKKIFLIVWIFALIYFSESRTAFVLVAIESMFALFLWCYSFNLRFRISFFLTFLALIFVGFLLDYLLGSPIFDFLYSKISSLSINTEDDYHLASNLGRWGSQAAAIAIMKDNVIFGVGLGQAGFMLPDYYPDWAFLSFQVKNWSDPYNELWPPVFSLYTRIGSELGAVGLFIFVFGNVKVLIGLMRIYFKRSRDDVGNLALVLSVFLFVSLFTFAQFGSFRFLFYWVVLSLSIGLLREVKKSERYD